MKSFMRSFHLLLIASAAFLMVKCGEGSQAAAPAEEAIAVKVQPVTSSAYAPVLNYPGTIASKTEARPSFKTGGIIARIFVKEGDRVSKGQLLATLDLTEINAQVQQSAQNQEKSQRDLSRAQHLYEDTVASLEQLENARTQLTVAGEALRIAEFNRQYARIHAPENGVVLKKIMNEGEFAAAGAPVMELTGTAANDWVVRIGLADKDWATVKKGDKAIVNIDAYPGKPFTGIVSQTANAADPQSGTYETEIKVLPGSYRFAPGLFTTIRLQVAAQQQVSFIPIEALTEGDDDTGFVYVLNEDKKTVAKKPVTIAFLEKDRVAISGGLENVSSVITDGLGYLTPQSLVKVVP